MSEIKNDSKKSIIVIGAGLTGLAVSMELCKKGFPVTLLEKQNFVGGLATSINYQNYKIDIGPHYLTLPKNSQLSNEIFELVGKENIVHLPRDIFHSSYKTSFNGRLYPGYPTVYEVIFKSGTKFFLKSIFDFLKVKLSSKNNKKNFDTARNYLIASYGKFLYDIWFEPYLSKKYPDKEPPLIDVMKKFPPLTLSKIISTISRGSKEIDVQKSLKDEDDFFICYFKGGMGSLTEELKEEIIKNGGIVKVGVNIQSIDHDELQKKVIFDKDEHTSTITGNIIIYAIPLPIALQWFSNIPKNLNVKLETVNVTHSIMVFLFIDTPKLYDSWVVIFYEKELSLARISQQNFLSTNVVPKGKTLLCVEIRARDEDPLWKANDSEIVKKVTSDLKKTKILTTEKIDGYKILKFRNLYTKYSSKTDKTKEDIKKYINSFRNEYSLGTETDSGILVSGKPEQELSKKIPFGGGMYSALANSKILTKIIINENKSTKKFT